MLRIIKAEGYKLINEIYLKIMALVCLGYVIIKSIPIYAIIQKVTGIDFGVETQLITGHDAFYQLGFDGFFNFFIPFLIVIIFSSEFAKKTIRNIVALKVGRINIYVGKYATFCISVFALMLFSAIISTALFTVLHGWGSSNVLKDILNILFLTFKYSIVQIAYASFIVILSLFVQNGALVIILYFGFSLIESIVSSIFQMLAQKSTLGYVLSYCFPSTYMYEFPTMNAKSQGLVASIISIAIYIVLTITLGSIIIKKKDIRD